MKSLFPLSNKMPPPLSHCHAVQMKKKRSRSTQRSCKSKRWRRKRRRNTRSGRSTNKLRCTIDPAKPCALASFSSLHPLHPQLPPIFTTPPCLHLNLLYQFYHHLTTKPHTSCLPPFPLLPKVSLTPLSTTPCHPPSRCNNLPRPKTCHSAPILVWRGWSLRHTST